MSQQLLARPAQALSIRWKVLAADLGDRLPDPEDETGAQAAEYAMLGGVSAAACGGLVGLLKKTDALEAVVTTVINVLTSTVSGWFS